MCKQNKNNKQNRGFTLLEILLVVGAIGLLSGIVIVAINPANQLDKFRNTKRKANVKTILNGIFQYSIDQGGVLPPEITETELKMLGTATTGCDTECGTLESAGSSSTNIALSKDSTANSEYSSAYGASIANDGNAGNFWLNDFSQGTNNIWWQIDLGAQFSINKIGIRWYNSFGSYNCSNLEVLGSNDGVSFNQVYGPIDTSTDPQDAIHLFSEKTYQYWRLFCGTGTSPTFYVIREIYMYESAQAPEYTEASCLDISPLLNPTYLTEIPLDPESSESSKTYYAVKAISGNRLLVRSCNAANEEIEATK